jgi:2-dehydropantoate 2-reductase
MRILVVGAGAVGGYFGALLAKANRDVTFLVRQKRAEEIAAKGLQIVSPRGDLTIRVKTSTAAKIASPYDVILLSVKSYTLGSAMNDFAPAVGPQTMILPMLNGMRHMDLLSARFGNHALLGGVCLVATELDAENRIIQLADFQNITFGELNGERSTRVQQLYATLQGAGFDTSISDQTLKDMWQKWVQLASLGAVTCLLRGNIGEIVAVPGGAEISLVALHEAAAIAAACGYPQTPEFLEKKSADHTAPGSPLTSSLYRDLKKNAPVEVETIIGDIIERGKKFGIHAPTLQAAFVQLTIYQQRLNRAKSASN